MCVHRTRCVLFEVTATTQIYTYWPTLTLHDGLPICHAETAFAPDHLAGVEGDDDDQEQAHAAADHVEHLRGHRQGRRAVHQGAELDHGEGQQQIGRAHV